MLRPLTVPTLTCPQCEQPGLHGNVDACLAALKAAIAREAPRHRPIPKPMPPAKPKAATPAPPPVDPLKPMSIGAACELLGVSRSTIYNWMREGKLPVEYTPGGAIRILRANLLRAKRAD